MNVQEKAYQLSQAGMTQAQVANDLGITPRQARRYIEQQRALADADPAAINAMQAAQSNALPHSFWVKTDSHSIYYKTPRSEERDSWLDAVADAFRDIPAYVPPSDDVNYKREDLLAFYAMADIHLGLRAWSEETSGQDYDTDIAARRVSDWVSRLVSCAPDTEHAIIVAIGDSIHHNDDTNQTPQSRHNLDVDTRQFRTLDTAINMFCATVECALHKHDKVTFCIQPGNHDRDNYRAIMFAMRERYRLSDRVNVIATPMEFFVHEFGKVMIACHHGDKAKANRLVLDAADRWPEMWGRTRHRFYFTGHLHSHKSEDIGGMQWEQLRAVTSKDSYAASHAYSCRPQMQMILFDRNDGEVARFKRGL